MKWLATLLVLVAVAAFAMKPSAAALEDEIMSQLVNEASNLNVAPEDDFLSGIAKLGCSLGPEECARLIRSTMTVEVTDLYVARGATIAIGEEPSLTCIGLFDQWMCNAAD